MARRTITIRPFYLPGGETTVETRVSFQLVNASGAVIEGYRNEDFTGVINTLDVVISDTAQTVDLTPNTEIYPDSYWRVSIRSSEQGSTALVQFDDGADLELVELLALDVSPGYWDVYESQLLPDPTGAADGAIPSVSSGQWVINEDPPGTGTVTSVNIASQHGLSFSGGPITGAGLFTPSIDPVALRSHISVDPAGTDNSTDVTLNNQNDRWGYVTLSGQELQLTGIDLATDVQGWLAGGNMAPTGVDPGAYSRADVTVDLQGRITNIVDGDFTHGNLDGLSADDHPQYALADGSRQFTGKMTYAAGYAFSADNDIVSKKYVDDAVIGAGGYTNEQAQDAVGTILGNTASITFTYDDAGGSITAAAEPSGIDHDSLANYSAAQHVDWASDQGGTTVHAGNIPDLSGTQFPARYTKTAAATTDFELNGGAYTCQLSTSISSWTTSLPTGGNAASYEYGARIDFLAPDSGGPFTVAIPSGWLNLGDVNPAISLSAGDETIVAILSTLADGTVCFTLQQGETTA